MSDTSSSDPGVGHPRRLSDQWHITSKVSEKIRQLFRRGNSGADDRRVASFCPDATDIQDRNIKPFHLRIKRTARALTYRRRSKDVIVECNSSVPYPTLRVPSPCRCGPPEGTYSTAPRVQVDNVDCVIPLAEGQGVSLDDRISTSSANGSNSGRIDSMNPISVPPTVESGSGLELLSASDASTIKATVPVVTNSALGTDNAHRGPPPKTTFASNHVKSDNQTLGISRRFVTTLLKKLPDLAEPNVVKLALSVVKVAIDIKDSINGNREGLAQGIVNTLDQLAALDAAFLPEESVPDCANDAVAEFKRSLTNALDQLKSLKEMSMARQIMDYEKCAEDIRRILLSISNAGHLFQNSMLRSIHLSASRILIHVKDQTLKKLRPSWRGDYKYVADEQTIRREECTLGTRVHLLQEIITWANKSAPGSPSVFWLTGQAGAGKTTIAMSVAKHFSKDNAVQGTVLGANFFCSRQFPETRDAVRITPTIVYQLARKCPHFSDALVVHRNFDTVFHAVQEQLPSLLMNPWIRCQGQVKSTYLIVIDALDELSGSGSTTFLGALFTLINQSRLTGLKFFITSRSEPNIVRLISSFRLSGHWKWLQDVPIHEVSGDIKKYLRARLPNLGDSNIELLNRLSNGLFIYAATAVRFLTPRPNIQAREQIELLRDLVGYTRNAATNTSRFEIDNLYQHIMYDTLANLPDLQRQRRLRIIHMMLSTGERSSPSTIAALLHEFGADLEIVVSVLEDLHSVLYMQDDAIYWYHASFLDFIFDFYRSNFSLHGKTWSFACNEHTQQQKLRDLCFFQLHQLRFNMGNIPSSFQLDDECYHVDPLLAYAAINWSHHLPTSSDDVIMQEITTFLELRALFWIEAMNLMKQVDKCKSILQRAMRWIEQYNCANDDLLQRLQEVIQFIYFFDRECRKSTPHLYISHLATWSDTLRCIQSWKSHFTGLPIPTHTNRADIPVIFTAVQPQRYARLTSPDRSAHQSPPYTVSFLNNDTQIVSGHNNGLVRIWDASTGTLVKELQGHQEEIYSLAVASDRQWLVTGSKDKSVRVWDAITGALLHIFRGHTDWVRSVAVSHDGTHIVTGSDDGTTRIWVLDSESGQWRQTILTGHSRDVWAVAISPTSTFAVSGSLDNTVRIWDVSTGLVLRILEGHTDWVHTVAISADSTKIVSGSSDNTVRLWSVATGQQIHCLEGHSGWVWSVAMSPDNRFIVSSSADHKIMVWDAETGRQLQVLHGHQNAVFSVALSSNGDHIVSGSQDRSIRVWDISGKQKSVLLREPSTQFLPDVGFTPITSEPSSEHPNIGLDAWVSKVDPRCAQWKVLENQWIVSTRPDNRDRLLMWLNIGHLMLQDPANTVVISKENNYGSIDFSRSIDILGENWTSCYTPI